MCSFIFASQIFIVKNNNLVIKLALGTEFPHMINQKRKIKRNMKIRLHFGDVGNFIKCLYFSIKIKCFSIKV